MKPDVRSVTSVVHSCSRGVADGGGASCRPVTRLSALTDFCTILIGTVLQRSAASKMTYFGSNGT